MIALLEHLLDATAALCIVFAVISGIMSIFGGVGWMLEHNDEVWGPRLRLLLCASVTVFLASTTLAVFIPDADTRKAIAAELEQNQ